MKTALYDLLTRVRVSPNHISASAYDTAWLAWLYPQAREWVIDAQLSDGSWGAELEYYHDRVIATLSAVNAIAATSTNGHDLRRIERGLDYLEKAIPRLGQDVFETVGFELLLPALVNLSHKLGLKVERIQKLIQPQMALYDQKLALVGGDAIYSSDASVAHSLEFVGLDCVEQGAIPQLRSVNGSIHSSPSATAFVELATGGSARGRGYLDAVLKRYSGTAPVLAPFELFEIVWVLHHLSLHADLKLLKPTIDPLSSVLAAAWTEKGVGLSTGFAPDLDDTSVGLRILHELGTYRDPSVLENFEAQDHFQCFSRERNISLDVHVHVVQTLKHVNGFPRRDAMLSKALNVVGRRLVTEYVVDKWHVSPYYSTSQAIVALTGLADDVIVNSIRWLLKTQREDGSWTFYPRCPKAAIEETAHALMALMTVYEQQGKISFDVIEKGFDYLANHYTSVEELPPLWIGKVLYNPYHIVEAVIVSSMAKYEELVKMRSFDSCSASFPIISSCLTETDAHCW